MAAVSSVEDHGYTLQTGVKNLTAFLRFKEAEDYISLRNGGRKLGQYDKQRRQIARINISIIDSIT